ncbi:hypothetical protein [Nocardia abscessus]|uniref:hypothetical protein n=1 Tax=Nocardia abscessus TaxID=120957 RepID=UPI0024567AF5|nr:hypothetical protein [Nocardia abscessus]
MKSVSSMNLSGARDQTPLLAWQGGLLRGLYGEDLAARGRDWKFLRYAYDFLIDPSGFKHDGRKIDSAEVLNRALWLTWVQLAGSGMRGYDYSGRLDDVIVSGVYPPSIRDRVRLSTRLLLECASALDELQVSNGYLNQIADSGYFRMIKNALGGEYGYPIEVAASIAGRCLNPNVIQALIDFALNPPIPGLTAGVPTVSLEELYPPLRFIGAAQALASFESELEHTHPTADGILNLYDRLTILTGLRYGSVDVELSSAVDPNDAVNIGSAVSDVVPNFVFSFAAKLLEERRRTPWRLSHYGLNFIGEGAIRLIDPTQEDPWWLHPPLRVEGGALHSVRYDMRGSVTHLIGEDELCSVFHAVALSSTLDDALDSVGPLTSSHLPFHELRQPGIADSLTEWLRGTTGLNLYWEL